jgi:hypothetical protein
VVDRLVDKVNATLPVPRRCEVVHADTEMPAASMPRSSTTTRYSRSPTPPEVSVLSRRDRAQCDPRNRSVNLKTTTAAAPTWAVFGNHWPSRSGGQFESEGYRAIAGETLSYFHQRVLEVHGPQTPVLAMGDFNDEPFDPSLVRHALSTRQRAKVTSARENPLLWNLMWPIAGLPDGSFYFDNQPNMLDQLLVNKNMSTGDAPIKDNPDGANPQTAGHGQSGCVPEADPIRRNGQAGQSERILRPLPNNHDGHRDRIGIALLVGVGVENVTSQPRQELPSRGRCS